MIDIDAEKVAEIIRQVAEIEVLPCFKNLSAEDIREKNPGDLVTVADEASEKMFTELLAEFLPGSLVVGEEAVSKDITVLEKLKQDKPVWVIDPIDGTHNFAHGIEKFGILVALMQNGITQYGWAFDVIGNRMAVAKRGSGVFINGERVKLSDDKNELSEMAVQGGGGLAPQFAGVSPLFKEIINLRCSLHDFMNMLSGEADAVLHINKITPWDHAAVNLMVEEAGGYVAVMEERGEEPYDPTQLRNALLLAAPNKDFWQRIYSEVYSRLAA